MSGGTLDTLRKACERAYLDHGLPVDTIMVAELNDITPMSVWDHRAHPSNQPDSEVIAISLQFTFIMLVIMVYLYYSLYEEPCAIG